MSEWLTKFSQRKKRVVDSGVILNADRFVGEGGCGLRGIIDCNSVQVLNAVEWLKGKIV